MRVCRGSQVNLGTQETAVRLGEQARDYQRDLVSNKEGRGKEGEKEGKKENPHTAGVTV